MRFQLRTVWKSPAVVGFCERSGSPDPVRAIKQKALELVARSGISRPPFSPFALASLQGVVRVKFRPMGFDACLIPVSGGFEVHICSTHSKARQNFSMAHEVAHLFFMEATSERRRALRDTGIGANNVDQEEEYLCDVAASELIFPEPFFNRDVYHSGPSILGVVELAKLYAASLQATAHKFTATGIWKCAFVFWKLARTDSGYKLVADRCITRNGVSRVRKDQVVLLDDSKILGAVGKRGIVRGRQLIRFGEIEDDYYLEWIQIGSKKHPRFLSIIVSRLFADILARPKRDVGLQGGLFDNLITRNNVTVP